MSKGFEREKRWTPCSSYAKKKAVLAATSKGREMVDDCHDGTVQASAFKAEDSLLR